jgi:hypothetical protein
LDTKEGDAGIRTGNYIMKNVSLRTAALTGIVASLFAVTACSGPSTPTPATDSATTSASAAATTAPEPEPTVSTVAKPRAADGTPLTGTHGLKVKGPANNGKGDYLQITVKDNDPAITYDANVVTPQIAAKFTPEEIAEAQKFAMTFVVEEGFDSTLNDGTNADEWLSRNADKFSPKIKTELAAAAKQGKEFINMSGWGVGQKYTYFYDKDSTRIVSYEFPQMGVIESLNPVNADSMVFSYPYQLVVAEQNLGGKVFAALIKGTGKIGVEKDPANPGKWLITEMQTKYDVSAGTENLNP